MKKLFTVMVMVVFLLTAGFAVADEWHSANQVTVRWDAVTTLLNGDPVPEGDLVTYNLYIRSVQTGAEVEVITRVSVLEHTITFAEEGDYHIGIRAVRTIPAASELPERVAGQSDIGWSSDPLITRDGNTFGVTYYFQLSNVGGLGI